MKALADIVNNENWCKNTGARDANENAVFWNDRKAVKFCMMGWIYLKYDSNQIKRIKALDKVGTICLRKYGVSISCANDHHIKDASEAASIFA